MCHRSTPLASIIVFAVLGAISASGQAIGVRAERVPGMQWRRVGPTVLELGLASPASGPVERVWFSSDGTKLFVQLLSRAIWVTADFENWQLARNADVPVAPAASPLRLPEPGAQVVEGVLRRTRLYAAGQYAYRSDDAGRSWTNLTALRSESILGSRLTDVAVSPTNPDDVAVVGGSGVWRSLDGGLSWSGLNDKLPNLPVERLLPVSESDSVVRIGIGPAREAHWRPGQKPGWMPAASSELAREIELRAAISGALRADVTAVARGGDTAYAGTADGKLFASIGNGQNWRPSPDVPGAERILRIAMDPGYGAFAVAVTSSRQRSRVLRTVNGGLFWDDITADLPAGMVSGVAVDRVTGAVYIASEAGVFLTYTDTFAAGPATSWTLLREGPAVDVMLDTGANQLYAAFQGAGVFAATAPHRARDPRVVSAADRKPRAVAPGALLSVVGARVEAVRAGDRPASVLVAEDAGSEVQLPFELAGEGVLLSFQSAAGRFQVGFPMLEASPGILVDREGSALVTNAETGLVLDASAPAKPGMRLQILATGLGRVVPSWPTGIAAPIEDPPRVAAPVRVYLDREPVEVLRATLAPGYVGLYVVEVQLPAIVNRGPAELYIEAASAASNRVRLFLEP